MYSAFENLYLRVDMNFGFISRAKDLTSSTTSFKSFSLQPVNFTIASVHPVVFLSWDDDKIIEAAAIYDGRKRSRLASSMATSWMYCAQKNTSLSLQVFDNLLYRSRNRQAEGAVRMKPSVVKISFSIFITYSRLNLFSLIAKRSLRSGGYISSYLDEISNVETPSKCSSFFWIFLRLRN